MPPTEPAPERLGAYDIVRSLPPTEWADVYLGRMGTGRPCELYVFRRPLAGHEDLLEEVQREVASCERIEHPALVRAVDCLEVGGRLVIACEHTEGVPFGRVLELVAARREHVHDDAAFYLGYQLAGALARAHEAEDESGTPRPLVHGCVHPGTTLVTHDGQVRLTGLVLCTALRRLHPGAGFGAYASFRPPEVARGERITPRSDAYALGLVLWSVLADRAPPASGAPLESLSSLRDDIPIDVAGAIDAALVPAVARRRITCTELEHWLAGMALTDGGRRELAEKLLLLSESAAEARAVPPRPSAPSDVRTGSSVALTIEAWPPPVRRPARHGADAGARRGASPSSGSSPTEDTPVSGISLALAEAEARSRRAAALPAAPVAPAPGSAAAANAPSQTLVSAGAARSGAAHPPAAGSSPGPLASPRSAALADAALPAAGPPGAHASPGRTALAHAHSPAAPAPAGYASPSSVLASPRAADFAAAPPNAAPSALASRPAGLSGSPLSAATRPDDSLSTLASRYGSSTPPVAGAGVREPPAHLRDTARPLSRVPEPEPKPLSLGGSIAVAASVALVVITSGVLIAEKDLGKSLDAAPIEPSSWSAPAEIAAPPPPAREPAAATAPPSSTALAAPAQAAPPNGDPEPEPSAAGAADPAGPTDSAPPDLAKSPSGAPESQGLPTGAIASDTPADDASATRSPAEAGRAARSPAEAAPAPAPRPPPAPDASTLPPTMGWLTVSFAESANVYLNGKLVGPVNQPNRVACGRFFVRVGVPDRSGTPRWLAPGAGVLVPCRGSVAVDAKPTAARTAPPAAGAAPPARSDTQPPSPEGVPALYP